MLTDVRNGFLGRRPLCSGVCSGMGSCGGSGMSGGSCVGVEGLGFLGDQRPGVLWEYRRTGALEEGVVALDFAGR